MKFTVLLMRNADLCEALEIEPWTAAGAYCAFVEAPNAGKADEVAARQVAKFDGQVARDIERRDGCRWDPGLLDAAYATIAVIEGHARVLQLGETVGELTRPEPANMVPAEWARPAGEMTAPGPNGPSPIVKRRRGV